MPSQEPVEVPSYLKISKVIAWLVYAWVLFGIIVLSLRVILLAFSASATAGFTEFIYNTSADYLQPFRGIFPGKDVGETGYLDVSALFAIIVYLIFAWLVSTLVHYLQSKIDEKELAEKDRQAKLEREKDRAVTKQSSANSTPRTR